MLNVKLLMEQELSREEARPIEMHMMCISDVGNQQAGNGHCTAHARDMCGLMRQPLHWNGPNPCLRGGYQVLASLDVTNQFVSKLYGCQASLFAMTSNQQPATSNHQGWPDDKHINQNQLLVSS